MGPSALNVHFLANDVEKKRVSNLDGSRKYLTPAMLYLSESGAISLNLITPHLFSVLLLFPLLISFLYSIVLSKTHASSWSICLAMGEMILKN